MSDLMQALLAREKAQRSVDRAVKAGEVVEAARINRESLRLTVTPRRGEQPASVRLHIERSHPYKPEQLAEYAGDDCAEDMVRALLAALAPHVHDDSLARLEGAVQ